MLDVDVQPQMTAAIETMHPHPSALEWGRVRKCPSTRCGISEVGFHRERDAALGETRASVTAEMLEEYDRIQDTLKSDATRPMAGIGFVLPGMLRPKAGGKS